MEAGIIVPADDHLFSRKDMWRGYDHPLEQRHAGQRRHLERHGRAADVPGYGRFAFQQILERRVYDDRTQWVEVFRQVAFSVTFRECCQRNGGKLSSIMSPSFVVDDR